MAEKTAVRIDKELLYLESIKSFLSARPELKLEGLVKIDSVTCRVFYFKDPKDDTSLTSEMIKV